MSHEDAATVRRAFEVWNESGPAAVIDEFWAEDAVYREGPAWAQPGVYQGRAAALERMQSLVELAGPLEVRLAALSERDAGPLPACVRLVGPDPASLAPYTGSFAVVHRLRHGLIVEA